ncbi:hypothetical protein V493_08626 [Pseudogymnoascus sp. VKM F-4281 (FW-2241)]|nr:hypothetical protein V493_08626 [Pseudogymnoascus sp. VKM F-4281 (FW-2241)]
MGNTTQKEAASVHHVSRQKRHREVIDNDEDSNSPSHRHRHRRQCRHTRSCTPSPSPGLEANNKNPEKGATTPPPVSLDRHTCQRCLKFLASEPEFECEFPARSTKCTRCTRLKDKCEPVPASADAEARDLLGLQAEYEVSSPRSVKSLRRRVVAAAENFATSVRMSAHLRPKTTSEINLALLHGQEEIIGLLRGIKAELATEGREDKRKRMGKERY